MSVECYAKVIQAHNILKNDITDSELRYLRVINRPHITYKKSTFWFCRLRLVEHTETVDSKIMLALRYLPGFRWQILNKCVDISWYEQVGGMFDWEDVPEVCSFLSQEEGLEDEYVPILPFSMCILRSLLVAHEEIAYLYPECFKKDDEEVETPKLAMPVPYLSDYIRDRL